MDHQPNSGQVLTMNVTIPVQISVSVGTPVVAQVLPAAVPLQPMPAAAPEALLAAPSVIAEAYAKFSGAALARQGLDWLTALSTADCSHLAYEEPSTVVATCGGQWQLTTPKFVQHGATQCFIASTDKIAVVAFRGTKGALDWFSNLNVLERRTSYGSVHDGFYRAFHLVRSRLEMLLEPLAETRKLVLTGHSLGGALATIAAAEWAHKYPIASVYTFGQPRVGFASFRAYMTEHFDGKFFRFVNADDIVPRVPPKYVHVGRLVRFNSAGTVEAEAVESAVAAEPSSLTYMEFERVKEQIRQTERSIATAEAVQLEPAQLEGLFPNYFSDHKLTGYLGKILKKLP